MPTIEQSTTLFGTGSVDLTRADLFSGARVLLTWGGSNLTWGGQFLAWGVEPPRISQPDVFASDGLAFTRSTQFS